MLDSQIKNIYTVFGLIIESEIELPELFSINEENKEYKNKRIEIVKDVKIIFGKVPENLEVAVKKNIWYEVSKEEFLLRVDGIAQYYVRNGEMIIIEPDENSLEEDIRVFLLSTVITVLLQERGFFVLHASAAVINGKAVLFSGVSGVGKTAIAVSLYDRGYELLSDEICAIDIQDGKPIILPGIPQLNVWEDSIMKVGRDVTIYKKIRQGINKYAFSFKDSYYKEPIEISNIVLLNNHNQDEILFEAIKGVKKFDKLMRNSYKLDIAEITFGKENHFKKCLAIGKNSNIIKVVFNEFPYNIDNITDLILKELEANE